MYMYLYVYALWNQQNKNLLPVALVARVNPISELLIIVNICSLAVIKTPCNAEWCMVVKSPIAVILYPSTHGMPLFQTNDLVETNQDKAETTELTSEWIYLIWMGLKCCFMKCGFLQRMQWNGGGGLPQTPSLFVCWGSGSMYSQPSSINWHNEDNDKLKWLKWSLSITHSLKETSHTRQRCTWASTATNTHNNVVQTDKRKCVCVCLCVRGWVYIYINISL
jgi:hypothetical protein